MTRITRTQAALLRVSDGSQVTEGATLSGVSSHGPVRLISATPDADGMITVQETYRVKPESVGLHLRPATVMLEMNETEMSEAEASHILELFQAHMTAEPAQSRLPVFTHRLAAQEGEPGSVPPPPFGQLPLWPEQEPPPPPEYEDLPLLPEFDPPPGRSPH